MCIRDSITAENASGLARIVRAMIIPSYENALLWHERDLANSSSERFTLSHAMILLDDILAKSDQVMGKCVVNSERMLVNIESQNGLVMAEKIMLALVDTGIHRDEAHEILRAASMTAVAENRHLRDVCDEDEVVSSTFSSEELDNLFDPSSHLGVSSEIVDESIALASSMIA